MKTLCAVLCFLSLSGFQLKAERSVKQYEQDVASKDAWTVTTAKIYVTGLGEGIEWANAQAKVRLYCPPGELALGMDNYLDILDRQIAFDRNSQGKDFPEGSPIGLELLFGLKRTFPCSTGK